MNLLMIIAVVGAVAIGEWFEAAVVAFLFSLALLLEAWSIGRARHAINSLMDLSPPKARVLNADHGDLEDKPVQAFILPEVSSDVEISDDKFAKVPDCWKLTSDL